LLLPFEHHRKLSEDMPNKKYVIYDNEYDSRVRLAYQRMACQAKFRGEAFTLTESEFRLFWNTPELFNQRGTRPDNLILTRIDSAGPWSQDNCVVATRLSQLSREHNRRPKKHKEPQ